MYNMQIFNMEPEQEAFMKRWKEEGKDKEHVRVTILKEAAEFAKERAPEFGVGQSALSLEISYLLLVAKDCLEKEESSE